jgi:kynurenine formamidase
MTRESWNLSHDVEGDSFDTLVWLPPQECSTDQTAANHGDPQWEAGPCAILDFEAKRHAIADWFDDEGLFRIDQFDKFDAFFAQLRLLEISWDHIGSQLRNTKASQRADGALRGLLIFSDSVHLRPLARGHPRWAHAYYYSPYLGVDAARQIAAAGFSFVGTDGFQVEDPLANFTGDEAPFRHAARSPIEAKAALPVLAECVLAAWRKTPIRRELLQAGVAVYENVNIPLELAGHVGKFLSSRCGPVAGQTALASPRFYHS